MLRLLSMFSVTIHLLQVILNTSKWKISYQSSPTMLLRKITSGLATAGLILVSTFFSAQFTTLQPCLRNPAILIYGWQSCWYSMTTFKKTSGSLTFLSFSCEILMYMYAMSMITLWTTYLFKTSSRKIVKLYTRIKILSMW